MRKLFLPTLLILSSLTVRGQDQAPEIFPCTKEALDVLRAGAEAGEKKIGVRVTVKNSDPAFIGIKSYTINFEPIRDDYKGVNMLFTIINSPAEKCALAN